MAPLTPAPFPPGGHHHHQRQPVPRVERGVPVRGEGPQAELPEVVGVREGQAPGGRQGDRCVPRGVPSRDWLFLMVGPQFLSIAFFCQGKVNFSFFKINIAIVKFAPFEFIQSEH
jgi:hypothetical protein